MTTTFLDRLIGKMDISKGMLKHPKSLYQTRKRKCLFISPNKRKCEQKKEGLFKTKILSKQQKKQHLKQ